MAAQTAKSKPSGYDLMTNKQFGNCIACHQVPEGAGPTVRADVGPRLDAMRLKGWDKSRLRDLLEERAQAILEAGQVVSDEIGIHRRPANRRRARGSTKRRASPGESMPAYPPYAAGT